MNDDIRTDPARSCENTHCPHCHQYVCYTNEIAKCERRQVKPAPVKVKPSVTDLGEWHGYNLNYYPDRWVHADMVDMELEGAWWKPGWKVMGARPYPLLANALLTAYRRAVERGLAMWPEGWEWMAVPMSAPFEKHHTADQIWLGVDQYDPLHEYPWPMSCEAESKRRAAMLGLCEPQSAPVADVEARAEVEARLEKAGAKIIYSNGRIAGKQGQHLALYDADGTTNLCLYDLTLARAEAALRASRGEIWGGNGVLAEDHRNTIAAKNIEIARLKGEIAEARKGDVDIQEAARIILRDKREKMELIQQLAAKDAEIAEARKSALTVSVSDEDSGKVLWLHFGRNCMVSITSLIEKSHSPLVKRLIQEWADDWLARNQAR